MSIDTIQRITVTMLVAWAVLLVLWALALCGCGSETKTLDQINGTVKITKREPTADDPRKFHVEWLPVQPEPIAPGIVPEDLTAVWPGQTGLYYGNTAPTNIYDFVHWWPPQVKERYVVSFHDADDETGRLVTPLSNGVITNCPPATYWQDAAGDIWDAKWIKR